jgi:hypothetical protein
MCCLSKNIERTVAARPPRTNEVRMMSDQARECFTVPRSLLYKPLFTYGDEVEKTPRLVVVSEV